MAAHLVSSPHTVEPCVDPTEMEPPPSSKISSPPEKTSEAKNGSSPYTEPCSMEEVSTELCFGLEDCPVQSRRSQRSKKYQGTFNIDEILPSELQEVIEELDKDISDPQYWTTESDWIDADDPDFRSYGSPQKPARKTPLRRTSRKRAQAGVVCNTCGKVSPNMGELRKHQRTHSIEKPFKCHMPGCEFRTRHPGNIKHHMRSHSDERPWVCGICGLSTKSRDQLNNHQWRKHNDEKPFACDACKFRCKSRWELKMHIRTHSDDRPFECPICGMKSKFKSDLTKHIHARHSIEKKYSCSICYKKFTTQAAVHKHKNYMHGDHKPVPCTICSRIFKHKNYLERHMITHSGNKPFVCDICGHRCANKSNLQVHLVTHEESCRPYRCPHCPYRAKEEWILRAHLGSNHREEAKHMLNYCDVCKRGFQHKAQVRQHLKTEKHKRNLATAKESGASKGVDILDVKTKIELMRQDSVACTSETNSITRKTGAACKKEIARPVRSCRLGKKNPKTNQIAQSVARLNRKSTRTGMDDDKMPVHERTSETFENKNLNGTSDVKIEFPDPGYDNYEHRQSNLPVDLATASTKAASAAESSQIIGTVNDENLPSDGKSNLCQIVPSQSNESIHSVSKPEDDGPKNGLSWGVQPRQIEISTKTEKLEGTIEIIKEEEEGGIVHDSLRDLVNFYLTKGT